VKGRYTMDKRLEKRGAALLNQLVDKQSPIIRKLSAGHTEEMAYYRYLSNASVSEAALCSNACARTSAVIQGDHVLVFGDSTDMDYSKHHRRVKSGTGLGYIGNGKGLGYNAHVNLVLDATSEAIYGLGDVKLWHRKAEHSEYSQLIRTQRIRNKLKKKAKGGQSLTVEETAESTALSTFSVCIDGIDYARSREVPLEKRESYRWLEGCQKSRTILDNASGIAPMATYIHDREGDLYDTFVTIPDARNHLLIRSKSNRNILVGGKSAKLYDYRQDVSVLGHQTIEIRDRKTGRKRKAILSLKCASVALTLGKVHEVYQKNYPKSVPVYVVYAEEVPETVPKGTAPIFWCILTTHVVETLAQAEQITYWYSLRWHIEMLFRLIKKDGFDVESSEIETGYALRKLGILTMQAAIQVLQLKQARDGDTTLPIDAVFTEKEVDCLSAILPTLEGKTEKQTNPFTKNTLPWAAWVIARLGGWKGYKNDRPPGVLTLQYGLDRFKTIYHGYSLRN
jgi:hypothetical protein